MSLMNNAKMNKACITKEELDEALRARYQLPSVLINEVTAEDCTSPAHSMAATTNVLPALSIDFSSPVHSASDWMDTRTA
jgi:hypothetical protein